MQVIYIMGVFMFVFAVVMGLTTTLSRTAMQAKLDNIAEVRQMFSDIEGGINNGILANQSDLRHLHNRFRASQNNQFSATVAARNNLYRGVTITGTRYPGLLNYVSWSEDQLVTDPWGTDIRVYYSTRYVLVDNGVEAPQTIFAYVSAGPDRGFDATLGTISFNNIAGLDVPANSDDIISVFSTYDAAIRTWGLTLNALNGAAGLIEKDYSEQHVQFLPQIEIFNTGMFSGGTFGFDNISLNAWESDPGLRAMAGFPRIATSLAGSLSLDTYTDKVPMFGINPVTGFMTLNAIAGETARTRLRLRINPATTSTVGWRVTHDREIDGRTIISN